MSSVADKRIITMGRLFPNGDAIDQLRGCRLVLWHNGHGEVGSTVDHGDQSYSPATLDPDLEEALHLPDGTEDFGCMEQLITEVRQPLMTCGLDEGSALLVATGILGTWVYDSLPGVLLINPWGALGTESPLVDLMAALCRRALRLAEPSLRELGSLPAGFAPTIILMRPAERAIRRLLAAATQPNTYFLSGGEVLHVRCPVIACTCEPVILPGLTIPLLPATRRLRRITQSEVHTLADRFQPRLLQYRLVQHLSVANSQFDAPVFSPEVRLLARILGAALEGAPNLQASLVEALRPLDEQRRGERSQTPVAVILEALLALCHTQTPGVYVGAVTELVNSLLESYGECLQLSPRRVGDILRKELGLSAQRRSPGYELLLTRDTQERTHRLGSVYNVLQPVSDCSFCQELLVSTTPDPVSRA